MPLHLPKIFRLPLKQAIKVCGEGESIAEVMAVLINEGIVDSYDTILEIKIPRDKALAVENFFMMKSFESASIVNRGKRGKTND